MAVVLLSYPLHPHAILNLGRWWWQGKEDGHIPHYFFAFDLANQRSPGDDIIRSV